ncbi:MAG: hypothetical protein WAQ98_04425 [Blastocatellia bacterium]
MINVLKQLSIAIFLLLSIGLLQIAIAQSSSMLVVPSTVPGSFAPSTPVLRFQFNGTGSLTPLVSIPETLVADSSFAAFNKEGELFIANRHGNQGPASISRFKFDSNGNFIANGTITGNSLEATHGLAFSPSGELFAANLSNGKISRFVFNASGTAVANGTITTPEPGRMGLAFSPQGELFVTDARITIHRYRFDPTTKAAIDNGSFTVANASRLHGITFNAQGDLFVADTDTNLISRFSFNNGNVSLVATTFIPRSPFGVAFSASGELFVSSHAPCCGGISRFTFDNNGNFVEGEFTSTGNLGGLAVFPGPTFAVSCQDLQDQVNTLTQQNQALTA